MHLFADDSTIKNVINNFFFFVEIEDNIFYYSKMTNFI